MIQPDLGSISPGVSFNGSPKSNSSDLQINLQLQWHVFINPNEEQNIYITRQSSCVTVRDIPPVPLPFWTLTWTLTGGARTLTWTMTCPTKPWPGPWPGGPLTLLWGAPRPWPGPWPGGPQDLDLGGPPDLDLAPPRPWHGPWPTPQTLTLWTGGGLLWTGRPPLWTWGPPVDRHTK